MTTPLERSLDRALEELDRHGKKPFGRRRGAGFSSAPWTLSAALAVLYGLCSKIVPEVWGQMLPNGWATARQFTGARWFVWGLAVEAVEHRPTSIGVLVGLAVFGFLLSRKSRALRPVVWLAGIAAIGLNIAILYVTLDAVYDTTLGAAGLK